MHGPLVAARGRSCRQVLAEHETSPCFCFCLHCFYYSITSFSLHVYICSHHNHKKHHHCTEQSELGRPRIPCQTFLRKASLKPSVCLQGAESPPLLLNSPIFGGPASYHAAAEASNSEEHHIQLLRKQLQQQEQQALAAAAQVRASKNPTGFVANLWCRKTGNPIISLHVVTVVAIVTESQGGLSQHVL